MSMGYDESVGQYAVPDGPKIPQPRNTQTPSDWDTVRQYETLPEAEMRAIPVELKGIPAVYALPAKRAVGRTLTVDALSVIKQPVEVISADPKLRAVHISATGTTVVIGTQEQIMKGVLGTPDGFTIQSTSPMRWEGFETSLYAACNAVGPQTISVRYEYWAD